MKIYRILCLGAAIGLAQVALAELTISNEALGQAESTLDFCSKAKPKSAAKYKERKKALVGDASEEDLAKARSSQEYKDSYSLVKTTLGKLPKDEAAKVCTNLLESK
jgi:chromosome condensin MukBEF ATPase and DNA-binding subunit MukB